VDNIDLKTAEGLGIWVTNAPLSKANFVAEHTIEFIIALARNMVRCDKEFRAGNFEIRNQLNGYDLEGKILGLIGLGRIGTMVAKKESLGLNMKVIGYDPFLTQDKVIPKIELVNDWEYIFKTADFISLHMPAAEKIKGIIGMREFELMKPTAYFTNYARGEVVNELDLIEALKTNKIAGPALDVFSFEPLPKNSPLLRLDNLIITPHNAALIKEATMRMALYAAIGIDEVLSGKRSSWPVNNPKL